jgi:acid phosphatase (class A)
MKSPSILSVGRAFGRLVLLFSVLAGVRAAEIEPSRPLVSARGHYAKLALADPAPAAPGLPPDTLRFENNPASLERLRTAPPEEFIRVSPDTFQLPAMPANSSAQARAEIDYLLRLQAQRTAAEAERALYFAPWGYSTSTKPGDAGYDSYRANLFYVGRSIGSWFNATDLPLTAALLHRVWRDASYHLWSQKFKYSRVRPVVLDARVQNLQETDWAAFPSGHASFSHMLAYFYTELAPEFGDIFLKDARDITHSREIIGVHYPSDSESGRVFARQFVNLLLQNERFQGELARVREEWARVRAHSPD